MGKINEGIRLPLTPLSDEYRSPLKNALLAANLLPIKD
jgi:dihydrodipicolinate synthase/N-acetylneuraminate lyase